MLPQPQPEPMDPKAVTRQLQHSILQLCNEHVGYTNKLQILGVLCMTIDDEQHELVVKVNNTLKRVHPGPQKDATTGTTRQVAQSPISSTFSAGGAAAAADSSTSSDANVPVIDQGVVNITPTNDNNNSNTKRHGRKGKPVKVEQVLDNPTADSEDEMMNNEEGTLTVIPTAPSPIHITKSNGIGSPKSGPHKRLLADKVGSAKRKATQQFRVPQQSPSPTPSHTSHNSSILSRTASPYEHNLALPVALPQTNGVDNQPQDLSVNKTSNGHASVKSEPSDNYEYSNIRVPNDTVSQESFELFSNLQQAYSDQAATITYSGLGLLQCNPSTMHTPILPAPMKDADGLSIKYTNTGPYTVGSNGRDVSNSSRIKDIILYNDQMPVAEQKGVRMETDFMVDKLATDGRKRRRRAAEDMMTPEEVSEYIGKMDATPENFQCKYCGEQVDSVLRYIQHTVLAHQAYICHQCGKSFTTKSSLLRHRPIHTGMRRFACSICKKTFYRKDKCKSHIKRHLGAGEVNLDQYTSQFSTLMTDGEATPNSPALSPATPRKRKNNVNTISNSLFKPSTPQTSIFSPIMPSAGMLPMGGILPIQGLLASSPQLNNITTVVNTLSENGTPNKVQSRSPSPITVPTATIESEPETPEEDEHSLVVDMSPPVVVALDSPHQSSQLDTPPPLNIDLQPVIGTQVA